MIRRSLCLATLAIASAVLSISPWAADAPAIRSLPGAGVTARDRQPQQAPAAMRRPPQRSPNSIVLPPENCGTVHTGWVADPNAVNPCPTGCERGEQIALTSQESGDQKLFDATVRCQLPELVIEPPPLAALPPGTPPRTNCGTIHTGWIDGPNTDVNPCPSNCERGELRWVNRSRSESGIQYDLVYQCYVANTAASAPATSAEAQPAPPPKATARVVLSPAANTVLAPGSSTAALGAENFRIGSYSGFSNATRVHIYLDAKAAGRYRVRATLSNVPGATTLIQESDAGSVSCPLAALPGYRNYQTCDLVFELSSPRQLNIALRKTNDTVAQVTAVSFDVQREDGSGGILERGQLLPPSPPTGVFDNLANARVVVSSPGIGIGGYYTLASGNLIYAELADAPPGTYRFRLLVSNTSAASRFNLIGGAQTATCEVPASSGYQVHRPCDVVVPYSGGSLVMQLQLQPGGSAQVTVNALEVFQE